MKKLFVAVLLSAVFLMRQSPLSAAAVVPTPVYQVSVVQTPAKAINYRNLKGSVEIDFKGTILLPKAEGGAEIKNKAGAMEIEARFDGLGAPGQFGTEYMTYVLWAISPDGRATNLGELIVKDEKSELNVKSTLQTLSLIVTAEPYYAVSQPSNVVVMENAIKPDNKERIELVDAKYELLPRGQYTKNFSATDRQPQVMDKNTPFYVYQARNAVQIAKAAGAETHAAEGFTNAQRLLALSETKAGGNKGRSKTAREAVQSAEDSRSIAVKTQVELAATNERAEAQSQVVDAKTQAANAKVGQMAAENAQMKAEIAKGQSDAVASAASSRALKAENEKTALRAQLLQQLNSILQTQDTARGLIVNMSDSLFPTGSAVLAPPVREKLAKIAGIVSSHPGLRLDVEGHTDSVGGDEPNQRLSEKRAQAARDYLISQGVPAASITAKGFGKTSPVASNDTAQGRSQNRRVMMILSGEAIGMSAQAQ